MTFYAKTLKIIQHRPHYHYVVADKLLATERDPLSGKHVYFNETKHRNT